MSKIEFWDRTQSKIYASHWRDWNTEQVTEWLEKFERVPAPYVAEILKHAKSGKELVALTRVQLKSFGIPWGICSHIVKSIDTLHLNPTFKPTFIEKASPYPWPYTGDLRPDNTALIIIDMQKDFVGDEGYAAKMYPETHALLRAPIEPIKKLLAAAREVGLTVIHTREGHHPNMTDCPANKRWRSEGVSSGIGNPSTGSTLVQGADQHDIIPELYPKPGEDIVDKPGKGSFYATNLEMILKNSMIENLIITGVTTDVCVHTTMREANDRGFECLLVEDACAAVDPQNQLAAIDMIHRSGGIFGCTVKSEEILKVLGTLEKTIKATKK